VWLLISSWIWRQVKLEGGRCWWCALRGWSAPPQPATSSSGPTVGRPPPAYRRIARVWPHAVPLVYRHSAETAIAWYRERRPRVVYPEMRSCQECGQGLAEVSCSPRRMGGCCARQLRDAYGTVRRVYRRRSTPHKHNHLTSDGRPRRCRACGEPFLVGMAQQKTCQWCQFTHRR
jgi:hypothetical protein